MLCHFFKSKDDPLKSNNSFWRTSCGPQATWAKTWWNIRRRCKKVRSDTKPSAYWNCHLLSWITMSVGFELVQGSKNSLKAFLNAVLLWIWLNSTNCVLMSCSMLMFHVLTVSIISSCGLPVQFPELAVTTEVPLSKAPNPPGAIDRATHRSGQVCLPCMCFTKRMS